MFKNTALVPLDEQHSKYSVILNEPQVNGSDVKISGVPKDLLAIKIDKFPPPDKLFSGTKGECKRADFALIADNGKKKRILIIELKRN
jgi:hypothetical protein